MTVIFRAKIKTDLEEMFDVSSKEFDMGLLEKRVIRHPLNEVSPDRDIAQNRGQKSMKQPFF